MAVHASQDILERAQEYLRGEVFPLAHEIDANEDSLRTAFSGLASRNLLALKCPLEFGGPAIPDHEFRGFQRLVARYSGTLAFLQTQHQSAVALLSKSDNAELKGAFLPKMGLGERTVGIAFSQLRRSGPPLVTAEEISEGYILNGYFPWATGHRFLEHLIVAGVLSDGRAVFGMVPFEVPNQLVASDIMQMAAMQTARTVTLQATDLFIPKEDVLAVHPSGWIEKNDLLNVVLQSNFAVGCAQGSLDILLDERLQRKNSAIPVAAKLLSKELDELLQAVSNGSSSEGSTRHGLETRAWAIEFASRAALAAISASGGAANSLSHPAQRLYRESLVYAVSAQTADIMAATLNRLVRK